MVSATDMFTYVLVKVRQYKTTITPQEFNQLAYDAQQIIAEELFSNVDLYRQNISGLRPLRVITDGINGNPSPIGNTGAAVAEEEVFEIPYNTNSNVVGEYGYYIGTSVEVKLCYKNHTCFPDGTESPWLSAKYLRDVDRGKINRNRYKMPNVNLNDISNYRIYYTMYGNQVRVLTGGDTFALKLKLGYLRYPNSILLNADGTPKQEPELPSNINKKIADKIVELRLEQTGNPRLQTVNVPQQ